MPRESIEEEVFRGSLIGSGLPGKTDGPWEGRCGAVCCAEHFKHSGIHDFVPVLAERCTHVIFDCAIEAEAVAVRVPATSTAVVPQ